MNHAQEPAMNPRPSPEQPWLLSLRGPEPGSASDRESAAIGDPTTLPADTLGLALSGGGIRSAAFCLGVLQALARHQWLRRVDYLSTVSGGGYIGAFLGRYFDLCAKPGGLTGAVPNDTPGAAQDRIARDLNDVHSPTIGWLRQHSNYLSPTGLGETLVNVAGFWRNLLSIYLVLAIFFFAVFGVLNAIGYSDPRGDVLELLKDFLAILTPLAAHLPLPFAGPWAQLAELVLWLAVLPLMVAYWLVSQDLPEAFLPPVLVAAALLAVALLLGTSSPLAIVILAAAVFWSLEAWAAVRRREGYADPYNRFRMMLARNHLTGRLAFWLAATGVLAALGFVDGLGRWLARQLLEGGLNPDRLVTWFMSLGAMILSLAGLLRLAAGYFMTRAPGFLAAPRPYLWTALLLVCGALPPLVVLSFANHAAYEAGEAYWQGLSFTALAVVVSLLLGHRTCVPFVNRSSPLTIYGTRLARAFLGAVNPQRRVHPEGRDVTHVIPGDDVAFADYQPERAGGPLHLINCAVNETIDVASQRGLRDRQAENLAIGPAGVNVAQHWHALWTVDSSGLPVLAPLAPGGGPHPFRARTGEPVAVEPLDLREWVAISGAALGPGMGRRTGVARALLLTLANVRLGYWWNSGLAAAERQSLPVKRGLWQTVKTRVSGWLRAQTLLLAELTGQFGGPWYRYWYLSDGGNFEVTGAYELLRRRVPFVIVCDAGQDRKHQGFDLAQLVRLARIDLGAEIQEIDTTAPALERLGVPQSVAPHLGRLTDLSGSSTELPRKHATLLLVRYRAGTQSPADDPWFGRGHTWLLYVKATLTGDESADVRNYAAQHPDFPNESTFDQVFDEPQWESYRKLGEHIGDNLFN